MKRFSTLTCSALLMFGMSMQIVQAQIVTESLVGWWKFEAED